MDEFERAELSQILSEHSRRYPLMEPVDVVKLVYQNEFGGGHLVTDVEGSLKRLRDEYGRTTNE